MRYEIVSFSLEPFVRFLFNNKHQVLTLPIGLLVPRFRISNLRTTLPSGQYLDFENFVLCRTIEEFSADFQSFGGTAVKVF